MYELVESEARYQLSAGIFLLSTLLVTYIQNLLEAYAKCEAITF